jgi:hypothetical protein
VRWSRRNTGSTLGDHAADGRPDVGVHLEVGGQRDAALQRVIPEEPDPVFDQAAQQVEEGLIDAHLDHPRDHPLADPVGGAVAHVAEQLQLVIEVDEQRALGDPGLTGDDVEAAVGEAATAELAHRRLRDALRVWRDRAPAMSSSARHASITQRPLGGRCRTGTCVWFHVR